mgnify:CR=1 FL=1
MQQAQMNPEIVTQMKIEFLTAPKSNKPSSVPKGNNSTGSFDLILNDYIVIIPGEVVNIDLRVYIKVPTTVIANYYLSESLVNSSLILLQSSVICDQFTNTPANLKVKSLHDDYIQLRPGRSLGSLYFTEYLRANT